MINEARILDYFKKEYLASYPVMVESFMYLWKQLQMFAPTQLIWEFADKSVTFWHMFDMSGGCELSKLAQRLFTIPANSVVGERAFSCMNLVHSLLRNRLTADKVNKLCYIHVNQRILYHNSAIPQDVSNGLSSEQVQIEKEEFNLYNYGTDSDDEAKLRT